MLTPDGGNPHTINVSTMTFVKAVLIVLALWFFWYIREIVAMVVTALLLAALIDPFADWFQERKIPRGLAVIIVYVILGLIATLVIVALVPVVIEQVTQLFGSGPFAETLQDIFLSNSTLFDVQRFIVSLLSGETSIATLFSQIGSFLSGFLALLVVLVLAFYMVVEEDTAKKVFKNLAPIEYQPFLVQLLTKIQTKIGAWLRGQLLLGLIVGTTCFIGLSILGVKYALLLGIIAGLFEIVPYVGPTLSVIPAVLVGFTQSLVMGVIVLLMYLVVQQVENNILVPKIMQKVTGLNPIVSIVALLVGIKIGGLVGAILSIPIATMLSVILEDLFRLSDPQQPTTNYKP